VDEQQVEVSTDIGYEFDARGTVEGAPVVTSDGVIVSKEVAEQLRAENRGLPVPARLHFRNVKGSDTE
jgi:hypothetical protein